MTFSLIFISTIAIGVLVYHYYLKEKKKYQDSTYLHHLNEISIFFDTLQSFNDYVTWVERDRIIKRFAVLRKYFKNKSNYYNREEKVKKFNDIFQDFDHYVKVYNKSYVETQKERLRIYLDDVEGKKLDEQQRTALITDEYSNLIIAGAGSGKTLTILGKVKYLIEQKNVNPENILLLSFTKKTVDELNERLRNMGLGARGTTFHKLGYDVIKKFQTSLPSVTNENTIRKVIKDYLEKDIIKHKEELEAYIEYMSCYVNIPKENDCYESLGEKLDAEKGVDFQTLKSRCEAETEQLNKVSKLSLNTFQGERVKSVEELIIANFLYLHGIEYEYEKKYPYGSIIYRPDFYLKDYDIYLEHFGIDENNCAKWLTPLNEKKYVEEIEVKREAHKTHQTKLLETYSYYHRKNILLEKLKEMLEGENVVFKKRDVESIYKKVSQNDKEYGKEITKLIETFINLCKSRQLSYDSISSLFMDESKERNRFMLKRQKLFLKFSLQILKKYDNTLQDICEIDFNDMINHAAELIVHNQPQYTYQYIIIDEYQDISYSRFNLINQIRELSGAKLICVGDDWQSIYRFAGSDISLFSNFEKYVGPYEKLLIEQTYRNSQSLIDITSRYIQKNKQQIEKHPKSKKEMIEKPIKFVFYSEENAEDILINEIEALVRKNGKKPIWY